MSRYSHKTEPKENEQNEPRTKRRNRICSNNTTRAGQIAKNYRERKKNYVEALRNRIEALEKENRMIMEEITRFKFLVQSWITIPNIFFGSFYAFVAKIFVKFI